MKAEGEANAPLKETLAITMTCTEEGIVRSADSNMLAVSGDHILITKDWGKTCSIELDF